MISVSLIGRRSMSLREEMFKMYARRLDEVLPEVFAVVKETARRFAQNDTIEVTATEADRNLAAV